MAIRRLDSHTINLIAAGEVVEDSASALKELLENSLDAQSRKVSVDLIQGGKSLLRVSDDGCGMSPADLLLSVERHATSKLQTIEDLERLASFGFRGEALPSIAAISRLRMTSSTGGEEGYGLFIEGGTLQQQGPLSRGKGTTVEVRDLFYNVPARQKFQKSASADLAQCTRWMRWMAVIHPHIFFSLRADEEMVLEALPLENTLASVQMRAAMLLKESWSEASSLEMASGKMRVQLILAPPEQHRPNRLDQITALNDRWVQCPQVGWVIREAYAQRLEQGRHPAFIARIWMAPDALDVNVHPQKREVRLRDERELRALLMRATLMLLERMEHRQLVAPPQESLPVEASPPPRPSSSAAQSATWMESWRERTASKVLREEPPPSPIEVAPPVVRAPAPMLFSPPLIIARLGGWLLVRSPATQGDPEGYWGSAEALWAVHLPSARRSWWHDRLASMETLEGQPMLFPIEMEGLLPDQVREEWSRWGFQWTVHEQSVQITAIPYLLEAEEAKALLLTWAAEGASAQTFLQLLGTLGASSLTPSSLLEWMANKGLIRCPLGQPVRVPLSEKTLQQYALHYEQFTSSPLSSEAPLPSWV